MPTAEQLRQFVVTVLVPPIAGALATWLVGTEVLSIFGITANAAAAEITQVLVFGVVTGFAWLGTHNVLSGHYTPAAVAARVKAGK